jgi:hypothetical protein
VQPLLDADRALCCRESRGYTGVAGCVLGLGWELPVAVVDAFASTGSRAGAGSGRSAMQRRQSYLVVPHAFIRIGSGTLWPEAVGQS